MDDKHAVHYSSERIDWGTPDYFYDRIHRLYRFDLDVAADKGNAKCERYYTKDDCGLTGTWAGARVWCNPPYGRDIKKWVRKAISEAERADLIVMLVPARTDTTWWHEAIKTARPVFIKGRLKFAGAKSSAPFPSALLIWDYH